MRRQKLEEERTEEYYDEERKRRELKKEKERRAKKTGKVGAPVKSVIQKITETKTQVPIIELPSLKLEKPKIEIKEVKASKEIPRIKREELEVKVPIIELPSSLFREREIKLKKETPLGEIEEKEVRIPLVRGGDLLDEKIDEKLLKKLEEQRRIETQKPQVSAISSEAESSVGGEEEIEEEPPEVIKLVFSGFSEISVGGPIIILYKELDEDSTIGSFETMCMRIFREKRGGHPEVQPIERCSEFNIREVENYLRAEKKIIRIDLDLLKRDNESKVFELISRKHLRETLGRFVVGDVSFLIFKARDEELYEHCKEVLKLVIDECGASFKYFGNTPSKVNDRAKKDFN